MTDDERQAKVKDLVKQIRMHAIPVLSRLVARETKVTGYSMTKGLIERMEELFTLVS